MSPGTVRPSPPSDATVLSYQSIKTNKAVTDATIEARVVCSLRVMNGVELPCRLLVADWPSIK